MKRIFTTIFLSFFLYFNSQNLRISYSVFYIPDTIKKDTLKEEFLLDIHKKHSVFIKKKQLAQDSINNAEQIELNINDDLEVLKINNYKDIYKIIHVKTNEFRLKIDNDLHWQISTEKKKIDHFHCQKATTNYNGRHWTAWFSPDIEIQNGPYIFGSLPGLIFEVYDNDKHYNFILSKIIHLKKNDYFVPIDQEFINISKKDYIKLFSDYYQDPTQFLKEMNIQDFDYREMNKSIQEELKKRNNPIERDLKIKFN